MTWIEGIRNDKKKLGLWEHIALVEEYGERIHVDRKYQIFT